MDTSILQPTVLFAFCGALGFKLLEMAELAKVPKAQHPDFTYIVYWLPFAIMPVLGGGLAYAYVMSGLELKPILAINVGISAPMALRAMSQINPFHAGSIDPGVGA
jgi:hypothetical protein